MDIRVLGPLEIWHAGRQAVVGPRQRRRILAILVHAEGRPVTVTTFRERVWDTDPPENARASLRVHLSRLRSLLAETAGGRAALDPGRDGRYTLRVDPDCVDLLRMRRLPGEAASAAAQGDPERAVELLREAERLWRGEPFAECGDTWVTATRRRLREELRRITERRIELELELGRHRELVGELYELTARHPSSEALTSQLMLALYRCERPQESLRVHRAARRRWSQQTGLDPGPRLTELHERILRGDRTLHHTGTSERVEARPRPPNNLPRDLRDFTGRTAELRRLLHDGHGDHGGHQGHGGGRALPLIVVHGMRGVGKSTLLRHAAHQLTERYPDGQLHVDLRGSSPSPCTPNEALGLLLRAVGVASSTLLRDATEVDERAALWRHWTANRRVLLVLDDARDASQVRPLLPGSADCRVLVASNRRLIDLEGAHPLPLELPSVAESAELFVRIAGAERISDVAAVRRIVRDAGCHPLTVQLLAGRFRHRAFWDVAEFARRNTDVADRLEGVGPTLLAAFQSSYEQFSPADRSLFRALAWNPGPDLTPPAAAALAGTSVPAARRSLERLLDAHLVEEVAPDRYGVHALVGEFARRTARREESAARRGAAIRRMLSVYLTAADAADRLAHPGRRRLDLGPDLRGGAPVRFGDVDEAIGWFDVERANLLAAARLAVTESPAHAAVFPHVLHGALQDWGMWEAAVHLNWRAQTVHRASEDFLPLAQTLVERAETLGHHAPGEAVACAEEALRIFRDRHDRRGEAEALFHAGRGRLASGQRVEALGQLEEALVHYRALRNSYGEAETLNVQGVAHFHGGCYAEAGAKFRAALAIHQGTGHRPGAAAGLNNVGEVLFHEGRHAEAGDFFERALALYRTVGGRRERANVLSNLGRVRCALGDVERSLAYFRSALRSYRAIRDARCEADVLINIGRVHLSNGRRAEAMSSFERAARIARQAGVAFEYQIALVEGAGVHRAEGRYSLALHGYREALRAAETTDNPPGAARALSGIFHVLLVTDGFAEAREFGERALALHEALEDRRAADALRRRLGDPGLAAS